MELINGNNEIIRDFFQSMDRILDGISRLAKESRPHLNGEKFLSNREASKYLKVSIRTLQEWAGVDPVNGDPLWYMDVTDDKGNPTGERSQQR